MRNLAAFVLKHHFFFLFLLFQVVCVWLMVSHQGYQGSRVLNSSNTVISNIYQTAANTREYFSLRQKNDILARENAFLRNYLRTNYIAIPQKEYVRKDTLYKEQYSYVSAKVVNSSVNKRRNYLTLNIGSAQGIRRDMAVITSEGVVGLVTDVSENFSSAMSILHKDVTINCQLKKDASYGPLVWDGSDYRFCALKDIPTHSRMRKGDTVITSEYSAIFPEGIMVGTVDSYERRANESFYTVKVRLSADLKKVNHVYIIRNRLKTERDSLEGAAQKQVDD
jgi:rod shape-determining protein MreC